MSKADRANTSVFLCSRYDTNKDTDVLFATSQRPDCLGSWARCPLRVLSPRQQRCAGTRNTWRSPGILPGSSLWWPPPTALPTLQGAGRKHLRTRSFLLFTSLKYLSAANDDGPRSSSNRHLKIYHLLKYNGTVIYSKNPEILPSC